MSDKFYHFYIALIASISFLFLFFTLSALGLIQSTEASNLIGEASRWCERVSGGLFREPVNTLSNLGFMIVGLYIFWILCNDKKNSNNPFIGTNKIFCTNHTSIIRRNKFTGYFLARAKLP